MLRRFSVFLAAFLIPASAFSHTLSVPFFSDTPVVLPPSGNPTTGYAAFVGVQNTTDSPIVLNIVYIQTDPATGDVLVQAPQQYTMAPREGVSWRPSTDDPSEGTGLAVPNANPSLSTHGGIQIIWSGGDRGNVSVIGRYVQLGQGSAFAHVLETAQ